MFEGSASGASSAVRRARRTRVVRLARGRGAALGFSLRGGREHAAGFFVTAVELGSEAHRQGLKVGDQVVSVNGYRVEDAVHSELTHYVATQARVKLKVRNVGMIPVKEKSHEPLTWRFVSEAASLASDGAASPSPTLRQHDHPVRDLRLSLLVPPKAKLGCGICKGPDWKPGIYVQFVKERGIARDSGLRAGDQILSCNGIDFNNVQFSDAISAMKQSPRLELRVRPGAGAALASPESSGYSSSASSAAGGDRSPHAPDKRLSIVAEEAADFKERLMLNRLKRRTWDSMDFDWRGARMTHSFDAPSDIEPDYDCPSIPDNPHTYENQRSQLQRKDFVSNPSNRTIINLTENGATIQCSYDNRTVKETVSDRRKEPEKKTIVVEVHRSKGSSKVVASGSMAATTVVSSERCSDTTSMSSNTTLSSAIAEEIMRRQLRKTSPSDSSSAPAAPAPARKAALLKPADCAQQKQHDALMDEFRKVHRKMFRPEDGCDADRQPTLPPRESPQLGGQDAAPPPGHTGPAPPPPPMPIAENGEHIVSHQNGHSKPHAVNGVNGKTPNGHISQSTLKRTPTPDYEATNIDLLAAKLHLKTHIKESAEVDSIESYKMRNPSSPQPKPPSAYFLRSPNGTATMKRSGRPVSVTIGEYPSRSVRKEPSKLDFLSGEGGGRGEEGEPIGSRLQSELALTLSRSNLRKKTELAKKLDPTGPAPLDSVSSDESEVPDRNFLKRYGHPLAPAPPPVCIPKVPVRSHAHPVGRTRLPAEGEDHR